MYNLDSCELCEINVCANAIYRKIFGYNKWESVKQCIYYLGRLDIFHIYKLRKILYLKSLQISACPVLCDLFYFLKSQREFHKALRIGDFVINLNLPYNLVNQMIYNDFADLVKSCT